MKKKQARWTPDIDDPALPVRHLSPGDFQALLKMLEKPPRPNAALRRAFKHYKTHCEEAPDPGLIRWAKRMKKVIVREQDKHALTAQQAADFLRVSRPSLTRLLDEKKIPYRIRGSRRRIRFTDLLDYRLNCVGAR